MDEDGFTVNERIIQYTNNSGDVRVACRRVAKVPFGPMFDGRWEPTESRHSVPCAVMDFDVGWDYVRHEGVGEIIAFLIICHSIEGGNVEVRIGKLCALGSSKYETCSVGKGENRSEGGRGPVSVGLLLKDVVVRGVD